MNNWTRHIVRLAAILAAGAISVSVAQAGGIGQASASVGVCNYASTPYSCYPRKQANGSTSTSAVVANTPAGFSWSDAGIGAAAALGLVLITAAGLVTLTRSRTRSRRPQHA